MERCQSNRNFGVLRLMSYHSFAYHYDKMMSDVDYSWWINHIKKNVPKESRILDVGCGTGTLTFALKNLGYNVFGLDLSENMLVVAAEKAQNLGIDVQFIQRDMRKLSGLFGFDCVLIALDSLNYLETENDVQRTLAGVHAALVTGGTLIFDVHTPHKMIETFKDYQYVENDDELTYIWHVEAGVYPLSVVHELILFAKNEDGTYLRNIEHHYQRTFEMAQYKKWLVEAGFEIIYTDGNEDRQLFTARKVGL